ncbi:DgyrCDS3303 [Dimorphilus gyrociliatus]|uniref:Metalloendopeptidase n=1 Tax=Dimorphilus gyrociliatus TaxID=2664684 RepID=A0A7I8VFI8_9ANNE|nr:DgyrCDS3303 [Dimorphilus gyrociliatus]
MEDIDTISHKDFNRCVQMCQLVENGLFADISFKIVDNGKEVIIKAHRVLLFCESMVFRTMLSNTWSQQDPILIEDTTPEAFKLFLRYIYSKDSKLLNNSGDVLVELLYLAEKYILPQMKSLCRQKILSNMSESIQDVCLYLQASKWLKDDEIKVKCLCLISVQTAQCLENGLDYLGRESFKDILLLEEISCTEYDLFCFLMEWTKNEKGEAREILGDLLYDIRFPTMSALELNSIFNCYKTLLSVEEKNDIFNLKNSNQRKSRFNSSRRARDYDVHTMFDEFFLTLEKGNASLAAKILKGNYVTKIHKISKRNVVDFENYQYEKFNVNKPIGYVIDGNYGNKHLLEKLNSSLKMIEEHTCLKFRQLTKAEPKKDYYINIQKKANGCFALIGFTKELPKDLDINLGDNCFALGTPIHEFFHTVGFSHEQCRPDRDEYVKINWDFVRGGLEKNFRLDDNLVTYGIPYDYNSLMQYNSQAFCKREKHICKQPTIITKDKRYQANLGQRVEISFLDGFLMNQIYCQCKGVSIKCQNGGYPHPKDCSKCKCPDGLGGDYCENVELSHSSCKTAGDIFMKVGEEKVITSPNYKAKRYEVGHNCNWKFTSPENTRIRITFKDFNINKDACYMLHQCVEQWVEVKFKKDMRENGYRLCCNEIPEDIISESNVMIVTFRPNMVWTNVKKYQGFFKAIVSVDGAKKHKESENLPNAKEAYTEWTSCQFRKCKCGGCGLKSKYSLCPNQLNRLIRCVGGENKTKTESCARDERPCSKYDKYLINTNGRLTLKSCLECCSDRRNVDGLCKLDK